MEIAECKSFDLDCNIYSLSSYVYSGVTFTLVSTSYHLYLSYYNSLTGHLNYEKYSPFDKDNLSIHSSYGFVGSNKVQTQIWVIGVVSLPKIKGSHLMFVINRQLLTAFTHPISYIPLAIKSVEYNGKDVVLISGSDCKIHIYHSTATFEEIHERCVNFEADSPAISLEIQLPNKFILGRENGKCEIWVFDNTQKNSLFYEESDVVQKLEITLFSPISKAILFSHHIPLNSVAGIPPAKRLKELLVQKLPLTEKNVQDLCICTSLGATILYSDILNRKFSTAKALESPYENTDTITSVCVFDYDFDKENEIFIGNYAGIIICYKLSPTKEEFKVAFIQTLEDPVMSLLAADIYSVKNNIGIEYLVAVTKRGLVVLSPKLEVIEMEIKEQLHHNLEEYAPAC